MIRLDWRVSFTMLFLFGAAVTSLFAMEIKQLGNRVSSTSYYWHRHLVCR
jgi:hypothetical protein